jgi:hypothetical protein
MKHRLIQTAAAVLVGAPVALSASTALAQQQPAPAAPPAATPAPGAPAPGAPGATPAPAPAPAAAPPPADKGGSDIPAGLQPKRFRFSTLGMTHSATTTAVGIGRDNIGFEEEQYTVDFTFAPAYWIIDDKDHKFFVNGELGFSVELTNSGLTQTEREPQMRDAQLGLGYNYSVWTAEDGEYLSRLFLRSRAIFPTSPVSQGQGRYLTTTAGVSWLQVIKILGNSADGLNNLVFLPGVNWAHLFSEATTPVNEDINRPRQDAFGRTLNSDQLTPNPFDRNRITAGFFASLPLYKDLTFNTSWRYIARFRDTFEGSDCEIVVAGECQQAQRSEDRTSFLSNSSVDFSLTQGIYNLAFLTMGYNNESLTLGEDGQSRNIFYSPNSIFYIDLTFQLDQVVQKFLESDTKGRNPFVVSQAGPAQF